MLLFFIIVYTVSTTYGEVLRIPCRRHGNFSLRHKEQYMTQLTLVDTFSISTVTDCILKCMGHDTCQHVNYDNDGKQCELLEGSEGTLVNKTGSEYLTTPVDILNHGPFCKSVEPCGELEECFDICEDKGYKCAKHEGAVEHNKVIKTLTLSKTWSLSVDILPIRAQAGWSNIVEAGPDGSRLVSLWFIDSFLLTIRADIDGNIEYPYDHPVAFQMNKFTNVRVEQVVVEGKYMYRVYINGEKVHEGVNNVPKEFNTIRLYASNVWAGPAIAIIKNLKFDNL